MEENKVTILIVTGILMFSIIVSSIPQESTLRTYDEIRMISRNISTHSNSTYNTIKQIDDYVFDVTNYSVRPYGKKSLHQFWLTKKGDCTEMAELTDKMLEYAGIRSRQVRGKACYWVQKNRRGRIINSDCSWHMWVEYRMDNGTWWTLEEDKFAYLDKI